MPLAPFEKELRTEEGEDMVPHSIIGELVREETQAAQVPVRISTSETDN